MANEPARYDAAVIQRVADTLYRRAAAIVFQSTFLGIVGGLLLGLVAVVGAQAYSVQGGGSGLGSGTMQTVVFALTLVGGIMGFNRGQSRALDLRFQAQQALVLMQIETNTRPVV